MTTWTISTKLGVVEVAVDEAGAVTRLGFAAGGAPGAGSGSTSPPVVAEAARQLDQYAEGAREGLDLPVAAGLGTAFERRVWTAACAIPRGETRTYGEVARAIGRPGAARAVGGALRRNPLMVVVPCHRVVGGDGSLTGYAGGLAAKQRLLELEGALGIVGAGGVGGASGGAGAAAARRSARERPRIAL